jgi:predicted RNA-binding Zn ribbon-like protein
MKETTLASDWDLMSERLPLDFANTVENHASAQPKDKLKSYFDLVTWSLAAGLLTENEAQYLLEEAETHPAEVSAALAKAIELRETIYRIFSAVANEKEPDRTDLERLNEALIEAMMQAQIALTSNGFEWSWIAGKGSFDQMLWPIAHSAIDLLLSEDFNRVGECADDRGCGWLFFDTSRNRSRRWCSMDDCGNRAKARDFYKRKTQKRID